MKRSAITGMRATGNTAVDIVRTGNGIIFGRRGNGENIVAENRIRGNVHGTRIGADPSMSAIAAMITDLSH